MRVLVTGAAGSIGSVVCGGLVDRGHDVAGLDVAAEPEGFIGAWFTADCTDSDAVDSVLGTLEVGGPVDAVVHLASIPDEASLDVILGSHVLTTATLLDAMLAHDVPRIVYASSNHAVGRTPRPPHPDVLGVDVLPRADTFYGVGKVAAEALLQLYADRHGLDALALRIGSFLLRPESRRHLSTWLSHDDAVRLVDACLTVPAPGYAVLYGISANTRAWWDLEPGRALGYHPEDDAERFAAQVEGAAPAGEQDDAEAAYVGGPFVSERFHRPARGPA
jgi:uronate dehydrogenase